MKLRRLLDSMLRLVTVLAVAFAVLSAPAGLSGSHDPAALASAEAERHAQLAAEIAAHGHSHDDGDMNEQAPGHSNGHDPADHLHDKAGQPPSAATHSGPATRAVRLASLAEVGRTASTSSLKRPPRPVVAA